MDQKRDRIELPDTANADMVDTALQVGLNLIPVVGGTFGAAAAMLTKQVVKQRTKKFFQSVVDKLEELGIRVDQLEQLQETFASRLQQGILAAQHTHQQDKLEALRNGVVNCLLPTAPEETLQQIFISLVDELTDLHLRLVVFLVQPTRFGMDPEDMHYLHGVNPRNPSATRDILERNVAPGVRRDLVNLCFEDLVRRGLAEYSTGTERFGEAVIPHISTIGLDFYRFITLEERSSASEEQAR
jgi:hypothetical protein